MGAAWEADTPPLYSRRPFAPRRRLFGSNLINAAAVVATVGPSGVRGGNGVWNDHASIMSAAAPIGQFPVSLVAHEQVGGHTIRDHVGLSDVALNQRLATKPTIPAASTFADIPTAELAVTAAIQAHWAAFIVWLNSGSSMRTFFDHDYKSTIGTILVRQVGGQSNNPSPATKLRVVVSRAAAPSQWFVLTAFPIV